MLALYMELNTTPRVRVDIKWDVLKKSYIPFDEQSGIPLTSYVNLTFGDPDTLSTDNPSVSGQTMVNGQSMTSVACKGYVTI